MSTHRVRPRVSGKQVRGRARVQCVIGCTILHYFLPK